ncbi:MAG: nucleotide-binding protein [Gemmatimonadota bacterium]|nr:nucleotide-binding protein [Gemmatimonadota bacterium]
MGESDDLFALSERLRSQSSRGDDPGVAQPLKALNDAANKIGQAWSGSWLGYQSRVYYEGLTAPPAGARFSQEWGFIQTFSSHSPGDWEERQFDEVVGHIERLAGNPDMSEAESESNQAAELFDEARSTAVSKLTVASQRLEGDTFLVDLLSKAQKLRIFNQADFIEHARPSGQVISRDMAAIEGGFQTPPHFAVLSRVYALGHPFAACRELAKLAERAASHLKDLETKTRKGERIGTNVFIGHGRASAWKDLRDFIRDRVHLPWDEFNRVPVAGVANIARLSQMLDSAAIAFLVMTAEDEQADGKLHARMNVIHEAGLFQGRLGFERAIVVLEEGCEEFTNIQGLGQIRFPRGNVSAAFEEIRQVLEREGLID